MTANNDTRVLETLLPWLANDTLEGEERARVAQYANKSLDGRRQLRQWQSLAEQMPEESYDNHGEDLAWARLNRALDCEMESQPGTKPNSELDCQQDQQGVQDTADPSIAQLNVQTNRSSSQVRNRRWAQPITRGQLAASFGAIAAIGLISTLALTLTLQPHPSQPFTTLSTPEHSALAANEVALRLAIAPSAGLVVGSDEFEVFLKMRGASLMSHSAQAGVVTVRVTQGAAYSDPARWQQETSILFAEHVK